MAFSSGLYQDALASAGVRVEGEVSRRRGNKLKPSVYCTYLVCMQQLAGDRGKENPGPAWGFPKSLPITPADGACYITPILLPLTTDVPPPSLSPQKSFLLFLFPNPA